MLVGLEPVHAPAAKLMSHQFLTLKNPDDVPSSGQCWSVMGGNSKCFQQVPESQVNKYIFQFYLWAGVTVESGLHKIGNSKLVCHAREKSGAPACFLKLSF